MDTLSPQQLQGESNRHANAEVIDKAGVLISGDGRARRKILPPENLADSS
jgi:hypothetical protein